MAMTADKGVFSRSPKLLLLLDFLKIVSFRASASFWHILRKADFGVCLNSHAIPETCTRDCKLKVFSSDHGERIPTGFGLASHETNGRMTEGQKSSK
jgi:hypothetical protein